MELHELPFGKIIILKKDIAEVIMNEGVEMNAEMVDQFHDFLLDNLSRPFSVLVNKINNYAYSFEAQQILGTLEELKAIAVVTYDRMSEISTNAVANFPRDVDWNMKIFSNRDEALDWILSESQCSDD